MIFLRIDDSHALGADDLQWILYRARTAEPPDSLKPSLWRPISFVSSSKGTLERCMRESGIHADIAALAVNGLPPTFDDWKRLYPAKSRAQEWLLAA